MTAEILRGLIRDHKQGAVLLLRRAGAHRAAMKHVALATRRQRQLNSLERTT